MLLLWRLFLFGCCFISIAWRFISLALLLSFNHQLIKSHFIQLNAICCREIQTMYSSHYFSFSSSIFCLFLSLSLSLSLSWSASLSPPLYCCLPISISFPPFLWRIVIHSRCVPYVSWAVLHFQKPKLLTSGNRTITENTRNESLVSFRCLLSFSVDFSITQPFERRQIERFYRI